MISPCSMQGGYHNVVWKYTIIFVRTTASPKKLDFSACADADFSGFFSYTGIQATAESTCRSYDATSGHCSITCIIRRLMVSRIAQSE